MKKDFSPEEKLLRLIRGAKKKVTQRHEESVPKIQPSEGGMHQVNKVSAYRKEKESPMVKSVSISLPFRLRELDTRTFKFILIILLACLFVYFIFDIFYTAYSKKEIPKILMENEARIAKVGKEPDVLEIKPYSYYSSPVEGRNIFMPQQAEAEKIITGPTVEEIRGGLSLIGIIAGERPQAIIEEKKAGKSYFVYKGGSVGQVAVVDILTDSVILEYKGERFELVL